MWLLVIILFTPIIFLSILLAHNAILYFTHGGEYGILPEKIIARQDLFWNISFYVHLPAGVICLLTPIVSFTQWFFRGALNLHKLTGKLYVWITLFLVCPTGMYLALYAKGGVVTQLGFMLQGILLALFTYQGYQSILKGNKILHVRYMIRSYAMVAVVLSFRVLHILFFLWKVPYQDNYAISQWLGLSGNVLISELVIIFINLKRKNSHQLKFQKL